MWKWMFLVLFLAGCNAIEESDSPKNMSAPINTPQEAAQNPTTELKVMEKDETGEYLADSAGMTLYYYLHDKKGVSACTNHCLKEWPPFYLGSSAVPAGFSKSDFGVITRPDTGEKQSTYKGYPLYYFSRDHAAGQTNGYSADDEWYTVNNAIERGRTALAK